MKAEDVKKAKGLIQERDELEQAIEDLTFTEGDFQVKIMRMQARIVEVGKELQILGWQGEDLD